MQDSHWFRLVLSLGPAFSSIACAESSSDVGAFVRASLHQLSINYNSFTASEWWLVACWGEATASQLVPVVCVEIADGRGVIVDGLKVVVCNVRDHREDYH